LKKELLRLKNLWEKEKEEYRTQEVGSGVQDFVKQILLCDEIFNLKKGNLSTKLESRKNEFIYEKKTKESRQADFVMYISSDIVIPVEVEQYCNIKKGIKQLFKYQADLDKKYGILTDGNEWRFYNNNIYRKFTKDNILDNTEEFLEFWKEYIKPEHYYLSFFEQVGQASLLKEFERFEVEQNREIFFDDITKLIRSFKNKLRLEGYLKEIENDDREKKAVEITYAYIIQFILYKTLVDNEFYRFSKEFEKRVNGIYSCLKSEQYGKILGIIDGISNNISQNIYRPFSKEQEFIKAKLQELFFKPKNQLRDVSPWLDIFVFIKKYNFANVKNDIFGYIYENYLKELYEDTKKGQYFTDPSIVNFMLDQVGYSKENIRKRLNNEPDNDYLSIIDPSCGSGTFLYSATDRLINSVPDGSEESSKQIESLVNNNVFGLDIAEFPLYLAEMSILMRMLPLIITEKYNNPIDKKIKVFKTKDSVAEFMNTSLRNTINDIDIESQKNNGQIAFYKDKIDLGYLSYVRDESDLEEMKKSLENTKRIPRRRFDFVIGNPPYISFKACSKQKVLFFQLMKEKKIKLSNIYGVNLHSIPTSRKKYAPNPNLYAFFIALGLALLKDNGRLCYIIPQTILYAGDLDVLRYHISKFVSIEKIITFSGKMFIGRGIKQNRPIATSSLIIVLNRRIPSPTHTIDIVHYKDPDDEIIECLKNINQGKKISRKKILQGKLLQSVNNWNFIKQGRLFLDFYDNYKGNTNDMSLYYEHVFAKLHFKSKFYFDRGLKYPKNKVSIGQPTNYKNYYSLAEYKKNGYSTYASKNFISEDLLDFPFGSQGEEVYKQKCKIVWRYINYDKFRFTEDKIMIDYNSVLISSNNRNEMLYLLSVLNSSISVKILDSLFRNENEKDILIGIKTIKEFIRIPKISETNCFIKKEIIKRTEEMLGLEDIILSDLVDFSDVLIQKFDLVEVKGNYVKLKKNDKIIKCRIKKSMGLVQKVINHEFSKDNLLKKSDTSLSQLKSFEIIDFTKQRELKDYIDDLIFTLYFKISLKKVGFKNVSEIKKLCKGNKFYKIANQNK